MIAKPFVLEDVAAMLVIEDAESQAGNLDQNCVESPGQVVAGLGVSQFVEARDRRMKTFRIAQTSVNKFNHKTFLPFRHSQIYLLWST
jgi:hypothetical protein